MHFLLYILYNGIQTYELDPQNNTMTIQVFLSIPAAGRARAPEIHVLNALSEPALPKFEAMLLPDTVAAAATARPSAKRT